MARNVFAALLAPALAVILLGGVLGAGDSWSAEADWQQQGDEVPVAGSSSVLETRWLSARPPGGPSDRVQVHRYRGAGKTTATLLYLPGTFMNGELSVASGRNNLWLYLASRGVEVFTLDYRTHFVPPESPIESLDFMADWTLEDFVSDARAAAALARRESGRPRVFVAGFSRGVTLAWGVACTEPSEGVAGIIVFDGTFKSHAPTDSFDFDEQLAKLGASGRLVDDVAFRIGWQNRRRLMSAAASAPSSPSSNPKFATVGDEVASILYNAWRPGGLADPIGGVSRVEVLAQLLDGYDRYWPAIQNLEGRSIADRADDPRTAIDDTWGELTLPVLYFGATGMGAGWILDGVYTAAKSGGEDVTLHVLEGYGHLDVLVGERARDEVFAPTAAWIAGRAE